MIKPRRSTLLLAGWAMAQGTGAPAAAVSFRPETPVMKASDLAAMAAPSAREPVPALPPGFAAAGSPAVPPPDTAIVVSPDADGVIDAAGAEQRLETDPLPNPFRRRYRPPVPPREIPLLITAVVTGGRPETAAVVVNGQLYGPGDTLEGLTVSSITGEALELRREGMLLRVPVQDGPVIVRLPR